jgi:hypothetical protein
MQRKCLALLVLALQVSSSTAGHLAAGSSKLGHGQLMSGQPAACMALELAWLAWP